MLKCVVRRKIKDGRLLALLDEIIDSNTNTDIPIRNFVTDPITGEMVATSVNGVPIGNYLSQYFANLFLAYFDHWIKE